MPKAPPSASNVKQPKNSNAEKNLPSSPGETGSGGTASAEATTSPNAPNPRKRKGKAKEPPREVLYPKISVKICLAEDKTALTDEQAKKLLGWQEESENIQFGDDYLFKDERGRKIRCTNNPRNRPLYFATVVGTLKQEILARNWFMNCENRIIGRTGLILNGQHTFIALVLACQLWEDKEGQYRRFWEMRPTIDTLIAFGCAEEDKVVNTMDTCKPRSPMDVIYRSEYFKDLDKRDRLIASRRLADAIKMLWHRTGAFLDAFRPRRTHMEMMHFIDRHAKIIECVKHITIENGDGKIARFLAPGYAAALMYLQSSSATDREPDEGGGYSRSEDPSEKLLDFERWDKAEEFWVRIASGDKVMDPVREAIGNLLEQGLGSVAERMAVLSRAWNNWLVLGRIPNGELELHYEQDGEGRKVLAECPTVEGIDLGNPSAEAGG